MLFSLLSLVFAVAHPASALPRIPENTPSSPPIAQPLPEEDLPVTVLVSALASGSATVKLYFYREAATFLKPKGYALVRVLKPGGQRQVRLPVRLAPGEWAVVVTQDLNHNDKVDKNMLGIPTEPFAFSNNVRPRLAPPSFADCRFTVGQAGQVVSIRLL